MLASSIAELIADRMDAMPAGERRAAQTLVANYPMIGLKTVADFSAQAGVSSPTILRFVARLGFQQLPGLPVGAAGRTGRAAPVAAVAHDAQRRGMARALAARSRRRSRTSRETFRHLSERQIAEIVALLAGPRARIFLLGGRFTDPIARYMAAHLTIIRPNVFHLSGQESNWRDQLVDMGKRDVLLIFDIRRYQDSLLRFAEAAHRRGVAIVLITDQWLSPIARFARHVVAGPHRRAVGLGFLGRAVRRGRDADRRADAPARGSRKRGAHPRDREPAMTIIAETLGLQTCLMKICAALPEL